MLKPLKIFSHSNAASIIANWMAYNPLIRVSLHNSTIFFLFFLYYSLSSTPSSQSWESPLLNTQLRKKGEQHFLLPYWENCATWQWAFALDSECIIIIYYCCNQQYSHLINIISYPRERITQVNLHRAQIGYDRLKINNENCAILFAENRLANWNCKLQQRMYFPATLRLNSLHINIQKNHVFNGENYKASYG